MARPPPDLKVRALNFLARREHSRLELEHKLARWCEDPADIARVLDELQAHGWLSEQRLIEQLAQARRGRYGSRRIAHELREKGVSEAAIEAAAAAYRHDDLRAARAVWQRKFAHPPQDVSERNRQMRFLLGRGFDRETIGKVLRGDDDD